MTCVDCGVPLDVYYGDTTAPRCLEDWIISYYEVTPAERATIDQQITLYRELGKSEEFLASLRRRRLCQIAASRSRAVFAEPVAANPRDAATMPPEEPRDAA